ncbi:S1 RNA-binding domain-containing protein [Desulfosporosinus metallidurans]|uniref:S1 RNA-binding domain-containing protein n=1 Tax=Desulfosporosinus metallidurans TaxID=1888891 RepID=UPI00147B56C9|nr:S1 RNA-binding domain-containing protein [Desulfosporosinus metallidurans]
MVQTLKLCYNLSKYEKSSDKVEYGLEICAWLRNSGLKDPFVSQVNRRQDELEKALKDRQPAKDISELDIFQPEAISEPEDADEDIDSFLSNSGRHFVGDIINVEILHIMPYGAIAGIDESIQGLIHISEIAYRYVGDIYAEFEVGEICPAEIIAIDEVKKKISLSTKGLGKFS